MKSKKIDEIINNYVSPYKFKKLIMDDYGIPLSIKQYAVFLNYLIKVHKKPLRILEIGAYIGLFIDFINKSFNNVNIEGIDAYEPFVDLAKNKNLKVQLGNVLKLDLLYKQKSFDIVLARGFFHKELKFKTKESYHKWINKIVDQVLFVLKPNGIFFFDTEIYMDLNQFTNKGFTIDFSLKEKEKYHFALLKKQ